MALSGTGQLSLSDIEGEFGGSPPTSLSEYYRGGGLVTSNNTGVPVSGQISLANFYGASALLTMYEQVLTGSGTFTPLYAGAKAIIQIGGGGGSAGCSCSNNGTDYSVNGFGSFRAGTGAGDSVFVDNIDEFAGGAYRQGAGGPGYSISTGGLTYRKGNDGTSSYLRSPSSSPYDITAGAGGGGTYNSGVSSRPSYPMSGTYPSGSEGLPESVLFDGAVIDPISYMGVSTGGGGSFGSYLFQSAFNSVLSGGAGFLRIYYLVE